MSNTFRDDISTSTEEYFSSDEDINDMDFIKSKKQDLKKFNVIFEKQEDTLPKYKKCMKCDESFLYPHEYLNHCKNTYFRCCDNINIDTEKLSRDEARKYAKYLKNKNADCLKDINNFYKDTFKNVNTDAKLKQKLSQRDITILNLRCQLEEEKTLRRSLMNTIEKDSNTKIKELTKDLEKEMNRQNDFHELLIMYNNKLEEAQQTIEEQKQLLTFYEAEKQSIHYGFNKANKVKREKTEKKKKEKPEKKLDTPPVDKPEKKEEIKEEKKEIVPIETQKSICEKKSHTPPITPQVKYNDYDTYTDTPCKYLKCIFEDKFGVCVKNSLNNHEDCVVFNNGFVYWYNPLKGCDIEMYKIGSYITNRDNICVYINEKDKQHENIQKEIDDYGCFWQPDAHYFTDHTDKDFIQYVNKINKEEDVFNNHEIDTMNIRYWTIEKEE